MCSFVWINSWLAGGYEVLQRGSLANPLQLDFLRYLVFSPFLGLLDDVDNSFSSVV